MPTAPIWYLDAPVPRAEMKENDQAAGLPGARGFRYSAWPSRPVQGRYAFIFRDALWLS